MGIHPGGFWGLDESKGFGHGKGDPPHPFSSPFRIAFDPNVRFSNLIGRIEKWREELNAYLVALPGVVESIARTVRNVVGVR